MGHGPRLAVGSAGAYVPLVRGGLVMFCEEDIL